MELYYIIAITDHDRGEAMGSLYHAAGLHLILSMPARGTATSEHLAIYGLDATEKCVIAAVGSAQEADSLIRSAKRKLFIDIPGNGVMLTVPLKSVAGGKTLSYLTDDLKAGGAPNMNFEHELITVILNEGYSDFVMDAARAAEMVGMPEARIPLAHAAVYLATAPKSNSAYMGINAAMDDVRNGKTLAVPEHLRTPTRKKLAAAGGADAARLEYLYSHDYPEHYVPQAYLPEGRVYYTPTGNGLELRIRERMEYRRQLAENAREGGKKG